MAETGGGGVGADRKLIGTLGERFAAAILFSEGWRILARNYRCRAGEIDLIAEREDGCICFAEVKTRMRRWTGRPAEAVDRRKQQRIRRAAQWYLTENKVEQREIRFMVFELTGQITESSFI